MHPTTTTCILIGKFPIQPRETAWKQTLEIESLRFAFKNQKIEILMNIFGKNCHEQLKLITLLQLLVKLNLFYYKGNCNKGYFV